MTLLAETDLGWLLDHRTFWINSFREGRNSSEVKTEINGEGMTGSGLCEGDLCKSNLQAHVGNTYVVREELFSIYNPYQMDSKFEKNLALAASVVDNETAGKQLPKDCPEDSQQIEIGKKRKRKKKRAKNGFSEDGIKKVSDYLSQALISVVKLGLLSGHFSEPDTLPLNNNKTARELALLDVTDMAILVKPPQQINHTGLNSACIEEGKCYKFSELCHTLYWHEGESPTVLSCGNDKYLIPCHSTFYLSQAGDISSFLTSLDGKRFDLMVMDPPWENRSVRRKKQYYTLPNHDLHALPVPQLCNDNCLVVVWVTNKEKHQQYIKEVLFPKWSVKYLTHWYWLKVTLGGEPIKDLLSGYTCKKPYEGLMLGRFSANSRYTGMQTSAPPADPPPSRVIISVPCILHSKKPPLEAIIRKYCVPNPECLELFARNLSTGWTSWGNEVLRHQHLKFYVKGEN